MLAVLTVLTASGGCRAARERTQAAPTTVITYVSPMWYEETARYFQVARDGRRAIYGSGPRSRLYDLTTGREDRDAWHRSMDRVDGGAFEPGGALARVRTGAGRAGWFVDDRGTLTDLGLPATALPRWSPDGTRIAFTSDRTGHYEIWTVNADGTNFRQQSFDSPNAASFPLWSPDGRRIVFHQNQTNVIIDVDKEWSAQTPQTLPKTEQVFVIWDWSPDGKKLLGTFSNGDVAYFSLETNRYERVAENGSYPRWLPDSSRYVSIFSRGFYLGDIGSKRLKELWRVKSNEIASVGISHDSQLIYFVTQSNESDIWLLDLRR